MSNRGHKHLYFVGALRSIGEVRQIDLAPTVAEVLGFSFACDGKPVGELLAFAGRGERVSLVIVDSLGYEEYLSHRRLFRRLSSMEGRGLFFRCLTYSRLTTPSIATILCGLRPERHRIMKTGDAYVSTVKCLPEVAYERGFRVAVVMERYGALSFRGRADVIKPVADRPDIVSFDEEVCRNAVSVIKDLDPNLLVLHFRSLDKLGFDSEVVRRLDSTLDTLFRSTREGTLVLVCGDHPPHSRVDERHVALIAFKI